MDLTTAAAALTRLLYSGEWTQANGSQYLRARFYDPASGRFNRLDPFIGNRNDPQSLHKYLYAHANPVMSYDPSGLNSSSRLGGLGISLRSVSTLADIAYSSSIRLAQVYYFQILPYAAAHPYQALAATAVAGSFLPEGADSGNPLGGPSAATRKGRKAAQDGFEEFVDLASTWFRRRRPYWGAPTGPTITQGPANPRAPRRPSWRQSERATEGEIPHGDSQRSFGQGGADVPNGTAGSSRPDIFVQGHSIEVKNYNLQTARGRSSLVSNVSGQAIGRAGNLPPGTTQHVIIDIRGQQVSHSDMHDVASRIAENSNGAVDIGNITFWTD